MEGWKGDPRPANLWEGRLGIHSVCSMGLNDQSRAECLCWRSEREIMKIGKWD